MSRFLARWLPARVSRSGNVMTRLCIELLGERVLPSQVSVPMALPDTSGCSGIERVTEANRDMEASFTIKKTSDSSSPGF